MTNRVKFSDDLLAILMRGQRAFPEGRAELERMQRVGMVVQGCPRPGRINTSYLNVDGTLSYRTYAAKDLVPA